MIERKQMLNAVKGWVGFHPDLLEGAYKLRFDFVKNLLMSKFFQYTTMSKLPS